MSFEFFSCKVKVNKPDIYDSIQTEFEAKNYQNVLYLLENSNIPERQKTDWFYYDYALSLYYINQMDVRNSIRNLLVAYNFNPKDINILYHLGLFYFKIANYKKALYFFNKALKIDSNYTDCNVISLNDWKRYSEINLKKIPDYQNKNFSKDSLPELKKQLDSVIFNSDFSEVKKIFEIESLLKNYTIYDYEQLFKENIDLIEEVELKKYLQIKILFSKMLKNNAMEKEFSDFLTKNEVGIYTFQSKYSILKENYYKYLCFFYYKNKDYQKANKYLGFYKKYKYKPLKYEIEYSNDSCNLSKEFKSDYEFYLLRSFNE